jgi:hypothetical protein
VNADQRFAVILLVLGGGITLATTAFTMLAKSLWSFSKQWVQTSDKLIEQSDDIKQLIRQKEVEHQRLSRVDEWLAGQIKEHDERLRWLERRREADGG